MWTLLLLLPAHAGALGQPVPDPEVERVALALRAEDETAGVRAAGCAEEEGCEALWEQRRWTAELSVALLHGLGIYGGLSRGYELVEAAEYEGVGQAWMLGARLALPVAGALGVAADARYASSQTEGAAVSGAAGGAGSGRWRSPQLSLLGTFGSPASGGLGWVGAQATPGWASALVPLGEVDGVPLASLDLQPTLPLSAVFGLAGVSEELGLPWRRTARISAGAEAWLGRTSGLSLWLGIGL